MKDMGKQMIKHCGGLPLAVKVLGGLLAAQYTFPEWERIYENIGSHIVGGTSFNERNIIYHVLHLSFEELPAYLKHCFLYLAHFPEDYEISVETLSYYWAAEEITRPRHYDGASIRDVADRYITELVKRNMVISKRNVETSRFETCQLHDIMREVCLHKADEENFVQGTSTVNSKSPCISRRLSVVSWSADTFNAETEVKNPSLRTLLFIKSRRWTATSLLFTRHKLMRVLDLSLVKFEGGKLPSSIGKLIHLRYLNLSFAYVTHLPYSMRNLKQLLYLDICVPEGEVFMPNILKEMRELAYLYLPNRLHDKVKIELGDLIKLETLGNFSTEHGNDDEVRFILNCIHLRKLRLIIYMPTLPDKRHFPSIHLGQCGLEEDPMPILEKLLHLKQVTFWEKALSCKKRVCSRGGFPQLQKIEIRKLEELEECKIEEGSMPLLHSLCIGDCGKLKEIPKGLRFITSLEKLTCYGMGVEWKKRLSKGGEDYYKVQHIPNVKFFR